MMDIAFLKSGIETRNKAFNALIERIEQVAMNSTAPVLITGPTGAGKSNLARRIYEKKKHFFPWALMRKNKRKANDSDRLRKHLAKYYIKWNDI